MRHILRRKPISHIVEDNYVHAFVLYFFGINFYKYSDATLEEVCISKGLDVATVINRLESITLPPDRRDISLNAYPVDLIIEYLKHTHHIYVKEKLPYVANLIQDLEPSDDNKTISDLKFIFPFFVEDFVKHIYEEEDTLFNYILLLHQGLEKKVNYGKLFYALEKHSIQEFALDHSQEDDEMKGIRKLTNNYQLKDPGNLHLKVVYAELQAFEQDLHIHAKIENEILFPKALQLEFEINQKIRKIIPSN
ncbi:MAG TPA: hemerythrin domain-containing protein [Cytophagaceae bacterium]